MERFEITYIVKGYIDDGQRLMDSDIYNTEMELKTYYYDLDYMMLLVGDDYVEGNICYFSIEDGADYNEVLKSISDIANKYEENVSIGSLEGSFARRAENDAKQAKMLMQQSAKVALKSQAIHYTLMALNKVVSRLAAMAKLVVTP